MTVPSSLGRRMIEAHQSPSERPAELALLRADLADKRRAEEQRVRWWTRIGILWPVIVLAVASSGSRFGIATSMISVVLAPVLLTVPWMFRGMVAYDLRQLHRRYEALGEAQDGVAPR